MSAIAANSDVPVSVKCRIGVDNHDSYEELCKLWYLQKKITNNGLICSQFWWHKANSINDS